MGTTPKKIHVQYFAVLREERGISQETLTTSAATPGEIYKELQDKYKFKLSTNQLKIAVNNEFKDWNTLLNPNDTIVFVPPVAGG